MEVHHLFPWGQNCISKAQQTRAWSTHPHNYRLLLDAAREDTTIFRHLFSQNAPEYFHPSPALSLPPVPGFKTPHHDTALWEGRTPARSRWMWPARRFPSNSLQVRAGPFLLILLGSGAAAGTLPSRQRHHRRVRDGGCKLLIPLTGPWVASDSSLLSRGSAHL